MEPRRFSLQDVVDGEHLVRGMTDDELVFMTCYSARLQGVYETRMADAPTPGMGKAAANEAALANRVMTIVTTEIKRRLQTPRDRWVA